MEGCLRQALAVKGLPGGEEVEKGSLPWPGGSQGCLHFPKTLFRFREISLMEKGKRSLPGKEMIQEVDPGGFGLGKGICNHLQAPVVLDDRVGICRFRERRGGPGEGGGIGTVQ